MTDSAKKPISIDALIALVCDQLGLNPSEVTPTTHLVKDLGADSLDVVEMGLCIEQQYGVLIPEKDYEHLVTLERAAAYLSSRLSDA